MDSLTHLALGAAIGTAVLGRKAGPRAAVWGAVCATLPDLDVLVPYGDPVRDFTYHRATSHSIFWLSLVAPGIAWLLARFHRSADDRAGVSYEEWWLLVWLALLTHALLDACTVYGTQLLLPFSDYPVGLGTVFIIDPLYTLPVAVGLAAALSLRKRDPARAHRWNLAGLAASTTYLVWAIAVQAHVVGHLNRTLAATPLADGRTLATPTPFNTLLWRVLVMDDDAYYEGYVSLFDDEHDRVELVRHDNPTRLVVDLQHDWSVRRLAWFSKGFYAVREAGPGVRVSRGSVGSARQLLGVVESAAAEDVLPGSNSAPIVMTDLRMGQTPWFVFSFVVAERRGDSIVPVAPRQVPTSRPPADALGWLWRRIWDDEARPPYSSSQTRET